jgi:hypothetical protein
MEHLAGQSMDNVLNDEGPISEMSAIKVHFVLMVACCCFFTAEAANCCCIGEVDPAFLLKITPANIFKRTPLVQYYCTSH